MSLASTRLFCDSSVGLAAGADHYHLFRIKREQSFHYLSIVTKFEPGGGSDLAWNLAPKMEKYLSLFHQQQLCPKLWAYLRSLVYSAFSTAPAFSLQPQVYLIFLPIFSAPEIFSDLK